MKTIVLAIQIGRDARDLLRTDTLAILRESGTKIVIVSPAGNEEYFAREFTGENIIVETSSHTGGRFIRLFLGFANNMYCRARFSMTMDIQFERSRLASSWLTRNVILRFFKYTSLLLPCRRLLLKLIRWKYVTLWPDHRYDNIFDRYKPDLVVATCAFASDDTGVLKQAIRRKISSMTMVPSWDNLTSRGIIPVQVDKLIVWNDIAREQAVSLHGFCSRDIYVCGGPQFDMYFRREGLVSREEFFRKIGADVQRKLLTYTTGSPNSMPDEPEVVEIICDYIKQDRLALPCQLLVRLNPRDNIGRYEHLTGRKDVIFERAGKPSKTFPDGWDADRVDMEHLANLMQHSNVIINVASTITIDASCFDTPVVNVAFDGLKQKPYYDSMTRFYDYSHYKDIVNTGGVRIAWNQDELLKHINDYLISPELDREGRQRILQEQCHILDGTSGRKIAECILKYLESGS